MGALRDKIEPELRLRGLSRETEQWYPRWVWELARYTGRSPAVPGAQERCAACSSTWRALSQGLGGRLLRGGRRPVGGSEDVYEYLGRYTHRVASSRSRTVAVGLDRSVGGSALRSVSAIVPPCSSRSLGGHKPPIRMSSMPPVTRLRSGTPDEKSGGLVLIGSLAASAPDESNYNMET